MRSLTFRFWKAISEGQALALNVLRSRRMQCSGFWGDHHHPLHSPLQTSPIVVQNVFIHSRQS